MIVTANERDGQLIEEEERHCVPSVSVESRLTRVTLYGWMLLNVIWPLLGGICWRHTRVCTNRLTRHTGK